MFENHTKTVTKFPCHIITVDPETKTIQGLMRGGPIHISVYTTTPYFRWPKVGENWIVRQENGSWYLDSILQSESDPTILNELSPGDSMVNVEGKIYTNQGTTVTQKYTEAVGNGVAEEFTIVHNLDDLAVTVSTMQTKSPYEKVTFTYKILGPNEIKVKFTTKIATDSVTVIVIA